MSSPLAEYKKRMMLFKRRGYDMIKARKFVLDKADLGCGSVLEIGTGKGHTAVGMAQRGIRFTTIDLDMSALKIARKHLSLKKLERYAVIKKMNAEKLPFKDRTFDRVISVNFLHHTARPAACIREMCRLARRGVIIADINKRGAKIMDKVHEQEGRSHVKTRIAAWQVKRLLQGQGLKVKFYRDKCQDVFIAQRKGDIS